MNKNLKDSIEKSAIEHADECNKEYEQMYGIWFKSDAYEAIKNAYITGASLSIKEGETKIPVGTSSICIVEGDARDELIKRKLGKKVSVGKIEGDKDDVCYMCMHEGSCIASVYDFCLDVLENKEYFKED